MQNPNDDYEAAEYALFLMWPFTRLLGEHPNLALRRQLSMAQYFVSNFIHHLADQIENARFKECLKGFNVCVKIGFKKLGLFCRRGNQANEIVLAFDPNYGVVVYPQPDSP